MNSENFTLFSKLDIRVGKIIDASDSSSANNITRARKAHKIMGTDSDLTINTNRAGLGLVYYNTTQGWLLIEN